MGRPPISTIGFGFNTVSSESREPTPPAIITTFHSNIPPKQFRPAPWACIVRCFYGQARKRQNDSVQGQKKLLSTIATAAIFVVYAFAAFWPFEVSSPVIVNHAERSAQQLSFPNEGIAHTAEPPTWLEGSLRTHEFELELSVRTASLDQDGPARIFSLSSDTFNRNFTVGQDGQDLDVRVRTERRDFNGLPPFEVPAVFTHTDWIDLRVEIAGRKLKVFADGEEVFHEGLHMNPLREWDTRFLLVFGNELTWERPWLGDIRRAVVTVEGVSYDYLADESLVMPEWVFQPGREPGLAPSPISGVATWWSTSSASCRWVSYWVCGSVDASGLAWSEQWVLSC